MDTVQASDIIMLFRIEGETGNAWKVGLQTDSSTDESRTYESTPTKDGTKKSAGAYEGTHSVSALLPQEDEYIARIKDLVRKPSPEKLEVWEINRSNIADATTIPGEYSRDVVTSVSTSAGSEGEVEITFDTEVDGTIVSGEVNVTPELLAILQLISEEQAFVQPMTDE